MCECALRNVTTPSPIRPFWTHKMKIDPGSRHQECKGESHRKDPLQGKYIHEGRGDPGKWIGTETAYRGVNLRRKKVEDFIKKKEFREPRCLPSKLTSEGNSVRAL